jgi:MFS family permease
MSAKRNPTIYRIVYFLIFAGDALFSPFYSLYFVDAGLVAWQKSLLLALIPFFLFIGDYVFSFFATSFRRSLWLVRISAIAEVFGFLAFGFTKSFPWILTLTIFTSFFDSAIFQVMDATSAVAVKKVHVEYWTIRIFGSLAYAAALISGYFFISYISYTVLYAIASGLILCGLAMSFFIFPVVEDLPNREPTPEEKSRDSTPLRKNKQFILYLLFNTFFYGGCNILGYILTLYIKANNISNADYSLWYGLRVIAEIASMLLMPLFFKVIKGKKKMLVVGSSLFLVSNLLAVLIPAVYPMMVSSFMVRGFANAFNLVYGVVFLQTVVGDNHIGKACTLCAACCNAFNGIGNLVAEPIYDSPVGFIGFFWILFGVQAVGLLFLLWMKGDPQSAPLPQKKA